MLPHWRIGEDVEVVNLKPDRRNGLFAAPMAGAYAMPGLAVVVIMVLAEPAPIRLTPFVITNPVFHVSEPAGTFMVSPLAAFCIALLIHSQVAFLAVHSLGPFAIGLPALHDVPQDAEKSGNGVCDGVVVVVDVDVDVI